MSVSVTMEVATTTAMT